MRLSTKLLLVVLALLFVQKSQAQNCDASFFVTQPNPRCAWDPVTFTPTGNAAAISSYDWDFGDGGFSFGDTVNHVFPFYQNDTCYNVTLTVRDTAGNLCSQSRTVCILASPEIVVNGIFNGCRRNLTDTATFTAWYVIDTQITDMSLGPFRWDFGDGTPVVISANDSVQHTFTQFGRYQLTVSAPGLPCAIFTQNIDFFTDPIANINILNGPTFCEGDTVCLANLSDPNKGPVDAFTWDYRDGTVVTVGDTSTQKHIYDLTGTNPNYNGTSFQVQLTARNTCYTHITTVQVTIEPQPRAGFSWSPRIGCMPNPRIRFSNTTIPNSSLNRFFWDFGDPASGVNNTSTSPSPFHTFTDTGLYTVTLIVENQANRCGDDTIQQIVEISMPPVAQAIASDSLGCDSLDVDYTNTSFPTRGLTSTWRVTSPAGGTSYFINGTDPNTYSPSIRFVGIGTHFVELEVRNACGRDTWRDTIEIASIPDASIPVWPDSCGPVTIQPTVSLDSNNAPITSILWQFTGGTPASFSGLTPPPITFNAANNQVQVAITNRCGTRTVSSVFQLDSLPIVDAGPDVSLCPGDDTIRLGGAPVGGFWQSMNPVVDSQGNFFTTVNGSYDLIYTFTKGGCPPVSDSLLAFVDTLPLVRAPAPFSICVGANPIQLGGGTPAGGSYSGNLPGLVQNDSLFPVQVGTFTIYYRYQDSISGCENIDSTLVTVDPLPVVDAGPDVQFCLTSVNQQLNGTPLGGTWSGPCVRANGTIVPNCLGTGTFTLFYTFTDGNGCTNLDSMLITIVPPVIPQTMPDTVLCRNAGPLPLTATPVGGLWNNVPGLVPPATFDPLQANSGPNELVYIIEVGNSCEQTDTLMITVLDTLAVDAGPADTACTNGGTVTLTGFSPAGGSWSGPGITNPSGIFDPSLLPAGPYQLQYMITDSLTGCLSRDIKSILVVDPPVVDAGADTTFCLVNMLQTLTPATPAGGTWSGTCMLPAGSVNPTCLGIGNHVAYYTFTDANGCTSIDSLTITVIAPTNAVAMPDTSLCRNAGVLGLAASPNGGFWSSTSPGFLRPNAFDLLLGNSGPNEFVYTIFSGTSCEQSDTLIVTILDTATLSMAGPDTACSNGASFVLAGYSPTGGIWSGPGVVDGVLGQIDPSTLPAGAYTLTYTFFNLDSCASTGTSQLIIVDPPVVDAGADTTFCLTNAIQTLNPASPLGGSWSGPCINAAGQLNPACLGVGSHVVYYSFTDQTPCTSIDSLIVTVVQPVVPQTMNDTAVCRNSALLALQVDQTTGSWSSTSPGFMPPASFDPLPANPVDTFIYTIFPNTSCEQSDTLIITVQDTATLSMGGPDTACSNGVDFAPGGFSPTGGFWSGPGVINANPGVIAPSTLAAGTYTLQYNFFNVDSCLSTGFRQLVIVDPPVVDAGPDTTFCLTNNTQVLNPPSPGGGVWSGPCVVANGQLSPACLGVGSHVLYYSFTDQNGCTSVDSLTVTVAQPVVPQTMNDTAVCRNSALLALQVDQTAGRWRSTSPGFIPPASFDPLPANPTDTFIYTIFPNTSCEQSDTLIIMVQDTATLSMGGPDTACSNGMDFVLGGYSPTGGFWTGPGVINANPGTIAPSTLSAGTYTLRYDIYNVDSCLSTGFRQLVIVNPPVVDAGPDTTFCLTNNIQTLNPASPAGGLWSGPCVAGNGQLSPACLGVGSHVLYYSFTDQNACTTIDSLTVTVVQPVVPVAMNDTAVCRNSGLLALQVDQTNGAWSSNSPGFVPPASFDPFVGNPVDTFIYTIFPNTSCEQSDTVIITVIDTPIVNPGPTVIACTNDLNFFLTGYNPTGGTWTGPGIVNGTTGEINPRSLTAGNYTLTYTYTDPQTACTSTVQRTLSVFDPPAAMLTVPLLVCENDLIPFSTPTTGVSSYFWDFGVLPLTNDTSILATPVYAYTDTGTYTITLVVGNVQGCFDTTSASLYVSEPPRPSFTSTPDSACASYDIQPGINGIAVNFTDTSVPANGSYSWDFGGGVDAFGQTGQVGAITSTVYFAQGTQDTFYYPSLTISNSCDTVTFIDTILVKPVPVVRFGPDQDLGCSPFCPNWTNLTIGAPDVFEWSVDGVFWSNDSIPPARCFSYTGRTDTTFTIRLVASNACGADTADHVITVRPNTVDPFFNTDSIQGCPPLTVTFTSISAAPNRSFDLGDGTTTNQDTITHTYTQPGTYIVSHFVDNGCSYDTGYATITVFPIPDVRILPRDTVVCPGEVIQLRDSNFVGNSIAYVWDLGNGNTSIQTSPTVSYNQPGLYNVSVRAQTVANACPASDSTTIRVLPKPDVTFQISDTIGCPPLDVQVSGLAAGAAGYAWDFGDGNSSVNRLPLHRYDSTGRYVMSLVVDDGFCQADTSVNIRVFPVPEAAFEAVQDSLCGISTQVSFLNNSMGTTSLGYRWRFGDGDSSILSAPSHIYGLDGQYDVSLEAINSFGCRDTVVHPVWIFPQPQANALLSDSTGCGPLEIEFDNLTTNGSFTNVDLYLGDGVVDFDPRFPYRHTYSTGFNDTSYTAVLTVDYANGFCVDTIRKQVEVYSRPLADIVVTPDSLCGTPAPVSGQNLSTSSRGIAQYTWNWGDGGAGSSTRNADHTYNQTGDFDINMIVENDAGCADTATAEVAVIPQAEADIVADPAFGCSELAVLFSLAQPNAATNAQWNFGDGNNGSGLTTNHTYIDSGSFIVDVIVDFNGLCPDTGQTTIEVDLPPIAHFEASVSGFCIDSVVVSTLNLSQYADSVVWLFGDGRSSSEWEPEIIYAQPDDYVLTLIAFNAAFGCSDTFSEIITYRRTNALFDYVKDTICSPVTAIFTDMSTGATTWDWDFGFPAGRDTAQNPFFVYKEAGEYYVTLTITYNGECETSYTHPVPIKVAKTPKVSFFVSDPRSTDSSYLGFPTQLIYENEQLVQFLNRSLFSDGGYLWEFSEGPLPIRPVYTTGITDPQYTFIFNSDRDTAVHFVKLTAYDRDSLCPVSDSMAFLLVADNHLWVPTGFTPNGDSHNETWQVFIDTEYGTPQFVEILVFDRWGNVVFQGNSPDSQWDGTYKGRAAPEGVYTWYVKAQFHTSRTVERTGTVTLVR